MIDYKKGLKVSSYIVTGSSKDAYPTHIDELGAGGYRTVNTVADLALISEARSKVGMLAYVLQTNEIYILTSSGWNKWLSYDNLDLSLEDIKLDIIDLRYDTRYLASNIVNNYLNKSLRKGYLFLGNNLDIAEQRKTIEIDNLPLLGPARFPIPDFSKISIVADLLPGLITAFNSFIAEHAYLPNPTQPFNINDPISNFNPKDIFALIMGGAWLPETFIGNGNIINPLSRETVSSSTLAFTKVATARLFKILENSSIIVSSKKTRFTWENSIAESFANGLTAPIAKLYGYDNTFDFGANAQALDALAPGILKQKASAIDNTKADGNIIVAVAGQDYVDLAPNTDNCKIALIKPAPVAPVGGAAVVDDQKLVARSTLELKDIAPADATYILKTANDKLANAQVLSVLAELGGGILKLTATSNGAISIASGGKTPVLDDYVRPEDLAEEITALEGELGTLQAEVAALIEALETLTGVTIGWSLVNSVLSLVGMGTAVAALSTKKDLEQLKTDYSKSFTTEKLTVTEQLTIPSKLSTEIPPNSAIGSIFFCSDL